MMRISFKKQRNIDTSKISLTGSITSVKNNNLVDFESSLERDYIMLLEHDIEVKKYYEQPIKINYFNGNKESVYIPDFYVEYYNGNKEIIEIKYQEDIKENLYKYEKKFEAAKKLCKENNFKFKLITEQEIRNEKLFNAKFLFYYTSPIIKVNYDDLSILYEILKDNIKLPINDLISKSCLDKMKQAEFIYTLWYMIANHFITFNDTERLTMNTVVWIKKDLK